MFEYRRTQAGPHSSRPVGDRDFAIVTGALASRAAQDVNITLRFTDVFSRTDSRWQCYASQGTFVSE